MAKRSADAGSMQVEAQQILDKAKERGLESNFLFKTTFERYLTQLEACEKIKRAQEEAPDGAFDIRLIRLYNSTVSGANGTAATLVSIIKKLGTEGAQENKLREFFDKFKEDDED